MNGKRITTWCGSEDENTMPTYLDLERWGRRAAFEFFKDFDNPFFGITVELDVTRHVSHCRDKGAPFSLATKFLAMRAVNESEPFRMRLEEDRVVIYERVHPTSTELFEDHKLLVVSHDDTDDFREFCERAKSAREAARHRTTFLDEASMRPDTIHFSIVPWLTFTSVSHARHLSGHKSSEPKIMFGRYHGPEDALRMPVSVECHHALMDGLHVSQFLERLQALFDGADLESRTP